MPVGERQVLGTHRFCKHCPPTYGNLWNTQYQLTSSLACRSSGIVRCLKHPKASSSRAQVDPPAPPPTCDRRQHYRFRKCKSSYDVVRSVLVGLPFLLRQSGDMVLTTTVRRIDCFGPIPGVALLPGQEADPADQDPKSILDGFGAIALAANSNGMLVVS